VSSYENLAGAYDELTVDVQYRKRADWLIRQFRKSRIPVHSVLDLGCGTGTIACLLAARGYEVVAADASEEMLTAAAQKASVLEKAPLFLHQQMQHLRLLEPVDAAVSTLDALNYLTRPKNVQETFRRVYRALAPGGEFLFDVNSPYKLRRMDGQTWLDEKEDVFCVWRTDFSEKTKVCTYWVDLFEQEKNGSWRRSCEEHRERAWETEELTAWLQEAGFAKIRVTGDLTERAPRTDEDRLIFRCRKEH
jgi:ubiquinone/menaquinone biosynthesis C-methylase UbiE